MRIQCESCKNIYEVDETKLTEDYIQCPYCSRITFNPIKGWEPK